MDENLVYFFVVQKAAVNCTKVFLCPALCSSSQMKRIQTGQAWSEYDIRGTWKPEFHKFCFYIHFIIWHVWKLKSFHRSFKTTYNLFTELILLTLCQMLCSLNFTDFSFSYYSLSCIVQLTCGHHLENCFLHPAPWYARWKNCPALLSPTCIPALYIVQLSNHGLTSPS